MAACLPFSPVSFRTGRERRGHQTPAWKCACPFLGGGWSCLKRQTEEQCRRNKKFSNIFYPITFSILIATNGRSKTIAPEHSCLRSLMQIQKSSSFEQASVMKTVLIFLFGFAAFSGWKSFIQPQHLCVLVKQLPVTRLVLTPRELIAEISQCCLQPRDTGKEAVENTQQKRWFTSLFIHFQS